MKKIFEGISNKVRVHKKLTVFLVVVIVCTAYLITRNAAATPQTVTQTAVAEKGTLVISLSASGQVTAANSATVDTAATGVVKKVYVQNGQRVKAGDPLIEVDLDQDSRQKYLSASASYTSAKNNLASAQNQINTLQAAMFSANQKFINDAVARELETNDPTYIQQNATWIASENAYNNQQMAIAAAQSNLSAAALSLRSTSPIIYAPISGTVNGMSLTPGSVIASQSSNSNAASSQKIGSIVTEANPTITLNLTQVDIPKVKIGNKATIVLDAFSDKTFTGKVVSIDTVGNTSSSVTNYPTVIQLDTANKELFPNMTANANIILNTVDNVLLVPISAVQTQNGESTVRVQRNGGTELVSVETGAKSDTQIEIKSGINEGDTVITSISSVSTTTQTQSLFSGLGGNRGGSFGGAGATTVIRTNR